MSTLRRDEDHDGLPLAWDQASPSAISRDPGDRRTPPAAERVFAALAMPWDRQIDALEAAAAELRTMLMRSARLTQLESQLLRVQNTEKLARLDLNDLARRRQVAISRAVSDVDENPRLTRKRRLDEARTEAAEWYDQKIDRTRRLTKTRLHTAEREQRRLLDERQQLQGNPLLTDPEAMALLEDLSAAITATLARDRAARAEALGDWARLRGTDERIQALLRSRPGGALLAGQAFGEGPIHLVADTKLVVIELRRGRDGVRTEEVDGDLRLVQVLPHTDRPLGLTDGSTHQLRRAARTVETATGIMPTMLVCVSAWASGAGTVADLLVCGPDSLLETIDDLEDTPVTRDQLKQSARALAMLPIPKPEAEPVPSLDHLAMLQPEDVPDGIPAVRDLIVFAHERRHDAY